MFGLNVLFGALGALLLAVVLTVSLVLRRRRRRRASAPTSLDAVVVQGTTYWGGGNWPTIVVRSHGRLRSGTSRRRPVEMVPVPVSSPWEPPRAS